eukprot:9915928-Ditylum_brightwellii.AAC.1
MVDYEDTNKDEIKVNNDEPFVPNVIVSDNEVTLYITNPNGSVTPPASKDEVTATIGRTILP